VKFQKKDLEKITKFGKKRLREIHKKKDLVKITKCKKKKKISEIK
jgi:hypothetical protein